MAELEEKNFDDRFTWDYCIVFRIPEDDAEDPPVLSGPEIVDRIRDAGVHTKLYQSVGRDEVYVLLGADEGRLEKEADRIDLDMCMESEQAIEIAYNNGVRLAKHTKEQDEKAHLISDDIWAHIYGPYDRAPMVKALFKVAHQSGPHAGSPFKDTDRINLTQSILECPVKLGGAGLAFEKIYKIKNTHMLANFPLHNPTKKAALAEKWNFWGVRTPSPLEDIRDYFGEKVALYFSFLQFYTRALIIPSFFGICFFIAQVVAGSVAEAKGIWFFALIIIVWSSGLLEYWKRTEAVHRVHWGMTTFAEKEQTRPEFNGDLIRSPIDGRLEYYFPFWRKVVRAVVSQSVILTFILLVVAAVAGMLIFRVYLRDEIGETSGKILGALLNSIQIQVFNQLYGRVSFTLNEYENHRTDTEYENALIAKTFLFKFVNSYNSLFYMAFFKEWIDPCPSGSCLEDLRIQLSIIFSSLIIMNNTLEVLVPYIKSQIAAKKESQGMADDVEKTFPEEEYEMQQYESTFDDFDELAIQFGFVSLFVVAFPLTPLLALANNILEVKVDSAKLLRVTRRPEPRGAANIGTWLDVFAIIAYISIITNIVICIFYTDEIDDWVGDSGDPTQAKAWAAILAEHFIVVVKFAIEYFIPDEPVMVQEHMARQSYLVDVLINGVEEEDDEDEFMTVDEQGIDVAGHKNFILEEVPEQLELDDHCPWLDTPVETL